MNDVVVISREELKTIISECLRATLIDLGMAKETTGPKYYTRDELATVWNVSKTSLYRFEKLGYIKSIKVGRKSLFDKALIDSLGIEGIKNLKTA